jgi:putative chitinase
MISVETLRKFAPKAKDPELHAAALEAGRLNSSVTTARRLCHFMAQIFIETNGLASMVEDLNYKKPDRLDAIFSAVHGIDDARDLIALGPEAIANRVYANRLGNGNEESGDGWRYRGSGYKQLIGLANYREIGVIIGLDLETDPESARELRPPPVLHSPSGMPGDVHPSPTTAMSMG